METTQREADRSRWVVSSVPGTQVSSVVLFCHSKGVLVLSAYFEKRTKKKKLAQQCPCIFQIEGRQREKR